MADLPDYFSQVRALLVLAGALQGGADALKPAAPDDGDVWISTDTERFYICYADGVWTDVTAAYLLLAGGTMSGAIAMGTNKITGLGDPAAAQDAATRAYVLAQIVAYIATHAAVVTAIHGVGAGDIVGTALTQILTNKTLTSPTIQGTVGEGTGLTLPTHTSGVIALNTDDSLKRGVDTETLRISGGSSPDSAIIQLRGKSEAAIPGAILLATPNATLTNTERLRITGAVATAVATWAAVTHAGLKLSGALDANSQLVSNLPAPAGDNDAARRKYVDDSIDTDIGTHVAAVDPHTGYRLESADHTHQSTGAQAGKLDHGLALDGLGDDDHTQYIKHALATAANDMLIASGAGAFVKNTLAEVKTLLAIATDIATHAGLITGIHGLALGARVYNSADQSIPNATDTIVAFDSERYDTDTIHDNATNNSRLTCKTAGKYLVWAGICFDTNGTGRRKGELIVNGATVTSLITLVPPGDDWCGLNYSTIVDLNVNDYIQVRVSQNSGGALNVKVGAIFSNEFAMQRIG